MAITWMDGFEEYSLANGLINKAYVVSSSQVSYGGTGRFSGKALSFGNSTGYVQAAVPQTATLSMGCAFKMTSSSEFVLMDLQDILGNRILQLFLTNAGGFLVTKNRFFTDANLGVSAAGKFSFGDWQYVEMEVTRHASAGAVNVYVNGALVLALTGLALGTANMSLVAVHNTQNSIGYIDDFYITDTATRIGEITINTLVPTADTAQKDFTALTGSDNYAMVDELPVDGDTSYVTADTAGDADLYATAGLADTPGSIYAVQVRAFARKTDTGLRTLKAKAISGGTDGDGVAVPLSTAYGIVTTTYETDPNTDAAWTASAVNAASIGMEIGA